MKKFLVFIPLLLFSCSSNEIAPPPSIKYPVKVAKVNCRKAEIYVETVGHVTSLKNVDIRSRIEGELVQVHFKEGQEVQENDLLFTIDPKPYEAKLRKSRATLQKTIADLLFAEKKMERYASLVKQEYYSEIDYEQILTDVARLQALAEENKAQIEQDEINLNYCWIYSPIKGKTGILEIDQGNLISKDGETPLITVHQISPIYVEFSIAEKDLPKVQKYSSKNKLKVRVSYKDEEDLSFVGYLDLINNTVNEDTGMIKLRAIFPNHEKELWPGQFVRTRLCLYELENACMIPFEAVVMTQRGPLVFVVKKDKTIDIRKVKLGQRDNENIIILEGLSGNETVVTEGQINLSEGSEVMIQKQDKDEPI